MIATSYPVPRRDQRVEYLEILDIAGLDLEGSRGASMLDAHRQDSANSILGTLDAVRREGSSAIGLLRFSSRPDVQPILEDVRTGITSQCSAGYEVLEFREGTDAQGRRTKTATKWRIREVSLVPVAADPHARTRNRPAPQGSRAAINRQIRELCTRAGVSGDVVDDLIDREATIEDARGLVLDSMTARRARA